MSSAMFPPNVCAFSPDRVYRYSLERGTWLRDALEATWQERTRMVTFIMLNRCAPVRLGRYNVRADKELALPVGPDHNRHLRGGAHHG